MIEWIRARFTGQLRLHNARRILSVAGILVLAFALGQSTMPSAVPGDHGPQATNCQACHGPPPDGNEEEGRVDDEGLYLIDNQPVTGALADGLGGISVQVGTRACR